MKKSILIFITIFTLISCGTPKTVIQSKKVIKGYWALNEVTYSETGNFDVTLLNDAMATCFKESTWRFIPNNATGNYTINNQECEVGERYFIFTIQEIDPTTGLYDFLLKPTNIKNKSSDNKGFRLNLTQLSETSMQWQQTVMLEGKPFKINMNFSKINE
ncbi:MAG: lipocalin [Lutibacter sp.]|uniref:lipocalin family protein n=1 Tax=Lutibacter sp. TaxID=1925666 RepID=UPI0017B5548F|nr:lipocalin family protein [Lutibacter sp.]MBT8317851.1 lipocalin family protein [Lutibacter sp.]NNJ58709.1 lipocalin [Lutibacter sp.]